MGSLVTSYANTILDQIVNTDAQYLALFTASPTDSGSVTDEVSASGYDREDLADANNKWAAAGSRSITTDTEVAFSQASELWGTITHIALCVSGTKTTSDLKVWGELSTSKEIDTNDQLIFSPGNITLSVAAG